MATILTLHIGRKRTGISVHQDAVRPAMYRIHQPNGQISDIVNLARAKDAALARAKLGPTEVHSWRNRQKPVEPPLVR